LTNGLLIDAETTVISAENQAVFFGHDENVVFAFFSGHFDNF
jgi:hypothetical protein